MGLVTKHIVEYIGLFLLVFPYIVSSTDTSPYTHTYTLSPRHCNYPETYQLAGLRAHPVFCIFAEIYIVIAS